MPWPTIADPSWLARLNSCREFAMICDHWPLWMWWTCWLIRWKCERARTPMPCSTTTRLLCIAADKVVYILTRKYMYLVLVRRMPIACIRIGASVVVPSGACPLHSPSTRLNTPLVRAIRMAYNVTLFDAMPRCGNVQSWWQNSHYCHIL